MQERHWRRGKTAPSSLPRNGVKVPRSGCGCEDGFDAASQQVLDTATQFEHETIVPRAIGMHIRVEIVPMNRAIASDKEGD